MESQPKIIEVNYGIASNYGDFIEIHHKLYGTLKEKILAHEHKHKITSRNNAYTKEDFKNDFNAEQGYFLETLKFSIMNPEAFVNFMPLMKSYYAGRWTWNSAALVPFGYFGIIFTVITTLFFSLMFKADNVKTFLIAGIGYCIMFALCNLLAILITHRIVKKDKDFTYKEVSA